MHDPISMQPSETFTDVLQYLPQFRFLEPLQLEVDLLEGADAVLRHKIELVVIDERVVVPHDEGIIKLAEDIRVLKRELEGGRRVSGDQLVRVLHGVDDLVHLVDTLQDRPALALVDEA